MAEPVASRHWLWRTGDLVLALLLVPLAIWLVVAGHFMATCNDMLDGFQWSILVVFTLPIIDHWTVPAWLGLGVGLASLRPFSLGGRFRVILAGTMLAGLAVALALGVTEHLLGLRSRCGFGL